jgi:hypothetical protein
VETYGVALALLEERFFTGRDNELRRFRDWLRADSPTPSILNVIGPGGVGKTTLLRAFGRLAREHRRPVVLVDGHSLEATPTAFLNALGTTSMEPAPTVSRPPTTSADDVVTYLNAAQPLLLVDTFEELGSVGRYLREELLPCLGGGVRVVVAGRYPLARTWGDAWSWLIRPIDLEAFSQAESRLYLKRRGIVELRLVTRILDVTAGQPLALSLAADLALQLGDRDFTAAPEWKLAAHGLVEQLLRDVAETELRAALDAAAVVRQFDESTLLAVTGQSLQSATFARLCGLSFVRASEHGLMLHDDVRRILRDDLRWRDRARYDDLRRRALSYYRERMRRAPLGELGWLVGERFYLWEDTFAQTIMYSNDEPGRVWVETSRPDDRADLVSVWDYWLAQVIPSMGRIPADHQDMSADRATFEALLDCPGSLVTVARNEDNRLVAFGIMLPVCQDSLSMLPPDSVVARVVHAYLAWAEVIDLPRTPDDTTIWYCSTIAQRAEQPLAENGALIRWSLGFLAAGGTYLCATADPLYRQVIDMAGFSDIPELTSHPWDDEYALHVLVLDLAPGDADAWMESITRGKRPPRRPRPGELERELQAILPNWHDDAQLAASPLADLLRDVAGLPVGPHPATLRRVILDAFSRARAGTTDDQALAYRAVEMAYFQTSGTRADAATRLAVSRRTFYRLLERGIRGLAAAIRP